MVTVAIIGPESSGKSTLARYLANRYQGILVPEYAREYVEQKGTTDVSFDELCEIARYQIEQIKSYSEAVCQSEGRSVLCQAKPVCVLTKEQSAHIFARDGEIKQLIIEL